MAKNFTVLNQKREDKKLQASDVQRLCKSSLEADVEVGVVHQLIKRFDIQHDETTRMLENWPWPVRIYTLGDFSIEINGEPLKFEGKAPKKPLELLKVLVALGGKNVSRVQLAEALWPDADGDDAYHSLAINLHRLRKLIGHETVIQSQGLFSIASDYCWSDLKSFEYHLSAASNELVQGHLNESWTFTQKALQLYKSGFLSDTRSYHDSYTMLSVSERLRRKLLHHIDAVGTFLCKNDQYEQAIEVYLKGLDIDDLQERFYRGLIDSHNQLGQKSEALSVYKQCQTILSSVLGCSPSPETQALIK